MSRGDTTGVDLRRTTAAEDRLRTLFVRMIGAGYCFYALLSIPAIRDGWDRFAAWWTPLALLLTFGTGIAMGAVTFGSGVSARRVRVATIVAAAGYCIATVTAPLAWQGPLYTQLWPSSWWVALFPGVPTLALAATTAPIVSVVYLVIVSVLVQLVQESHTADNVFAPLYAEVLFMVMFSLAFVVVTIVARRTGRIIDEATYASHRAAAAAAATAAREVERERFDALTHDGVMGVLLAACRLGTRTVVVVQARDALAQLDRLAGGESEPDAYAATAAVAVIRNAVRTADQRVVVVVESNSTAPLPGDVVRAMAAASVEAVRNSARHAGPNALCRVSVHLTVAGIDVIVVDDGCGFDPERVPKLRLGLTVSIRGRMRQLDGGDADIVSSPGRGTTVSLRWSGS